MKRILVSQRIEFIESRQEFRDSVERRLSTWLLEAGYLAHPVPNYGSERVLQEWVGSLDVSGVLISGGGQIGHYLERDHTENFLISLAESRQLPLLGICRGMQLLGVRSGAQLVHVEGHVGVMHDLEGEFGGLVNSFHDFALNECPGGYVVTARSGDGTIEAIRHEWLPWEGWMWHPERLTDARPEDIARVRSIFC